MNEYHDIPRRTYVIDQIVSPKEASKQPDTLVCYTKPFRLTKEGRLIRRESGK